MVSKARAVEGEAGEIECISEEFLTPSHPLSIETNEHVSLQVEDNTHSSCDNTSVKLDDKHFSEFSQNPMTIERVHVSGQSEDCQSEDCLDSCFERMLANNISVCIYYYLLFLVLMPFALGAIVVARLLQFFVSFKNFREHYKVKAGLRIMVVLEVLLLLVHLGLFYPIAKYVPRFKPVMIVGLPVTNWILLFSTLLGIFLLSQVCFFSISLIIGQIVTGRSLNGLFVLESLSEIVGCFFFWWALGVLRNSVPVFKNSKVHDIYTDTWIEVFLFLLIGYNIITLLTCLVVCSSGILSFFFKPRYLVYIASGIQRSTIAVLSLLMLLLTWALYFDDRLNSTSRVKRILKLVSGSLATVFICSFLWLIKNSVLLYWKAHAVYGKLQSKICETGVYLYFFVLLSHLQNSPATFKRYHHLFMDASDSRYYGFGLFRSQVHGKNERWVLLSSSEEENCVLNEAKGQPAYRRSVYDLQEAAEMILNAQHLLGSDTSLNLGHLLDCSDDSSNSSRQNNHSTNIFETLKKIVRGYDNNLNNLQKLLSLLGVDGSAQELHFDQVKIWMERAHAKCTFLVNVLLGKEEAAKCLNNVLTVLILGVTLICWLLLCELTTTTVLVVVATPLLAASFIFGDTCKSLFHRLMFVYVIHLFDVGDQCIIDGKQLEVKRIGVWNCIFSDVHARCRNEDIVYANSELTAKKFSKCKAEIDWSDYIEFNSCFLDSRIIPHIKKDLECYLSTNGFATTTDSIEFKHKGEDYKIAIQVEYEAAIDKDISYYEFLKEREKLRSKLSIDVLSLLKEHELRNK